MISRKLKSEKPHVDAICLGELLIDFVAMQKDKGLAGARGFVKAAGGAPANVAVGLARLGVQTAFVSKVGRDEFGYFLRETLRENHVNIDAVREECRSPTGIAFVSLTGRGDRDFLFYRTSCADAMLKPGELPSRLFSQACLFHFGSISLIQEPSRSATWHGVDLAQKNGLLISFDPNLRPSLWPNQRTMRKLVQKALECSHIVKLNQEELAFLVRDGGPPETLQRLRKPRNELLVVTLGQLSCYYSTSNTEGFVTSFPVRPIDTTGAGDAFVAGLLSGVIQRLKRGQTISELHNDELYRVFRFANACGATMTTTIVFMIGPHVDTIGCTIGWNVGTIAFTIALVTATMGDIVGSIEN
ncbi:carbohydrate kinase [soil metagenome]